MKFSNQKDLLNHLKEIQSESDEDSFILIIQENRELLKLENKFSKFKLFLKENNFSFKKISFRDIILREFKKNSKISKKELSEILKKDSNLKESRISEYMNYYFDLWAKLSNINSQEIEKK